MSLSIKLLFYLFFLQLTCFGQVAIDKIIGLGIGNSIIKSADGNLIYCGSRSGRLLVSKIDSNGNEIWARLFGLTSGLSPNNSGSNIIKVEQNFLVTGRYDPGIGSYNKAYVLLIDSSGNLIWENNYGNNNSFAKQSCYDSLSKAIYITGSIQGSTPDVFLLKIDTLGNTIWENTYDFGNSDIGESISMIDPNNIFIIGNTTSGSGNNMFNGYLMKIDSSGVINFQKFFGGTLQDNIYDFKILPDSGFFLVGTSNSFSSGNTDSWILRLNNLGDTMWTTTIGTSIIEATYSLCFTETDKIWICGKANTGTPNSDQGWLFEIDSTGNLINSLNFGAMNNETLFDLITLNSNLYSIGKSSLNLNDSIYFIRLDSLSMGFNALYSDATFEHTIYPNPTESEVYIKLNKSLLPTANFIIIHDLNGKEYSCYCEQADLLLKIVLPELNGIYLLNFKSSNINYSYKIIKY